MRRKVSLYNPYKNMSPYLEHGHFLSEGLHLHKIESPGPKDAPCQILFVRPVDHENILKVFCYINPYIKLCSLRAWPF